MNNKSQSLKIFFILPLFFLLLSSNLFSQEKVIDQVIAIVGKNIILQSDIETQYFQYRMQGSIEGSETTVKCKILENLLFEKLLLNQAEIDSVEITGEDVEQNMDRKFRYYIAQFGSQEKLEEFYKKSVIEIKEEMRDLVRDQMLIENIQQDITSNSKITPSDVKSFFKKIPADSLPLINSEVEIGQLVKNPPINIAEKLIIKEKLKSLRDRIIKGESFSTLAILYSEDPGSAKNGGELGLTKRGELYPEFEAVAFNTKKDEISEIVETKAGFHIIKLISRKGEYINVRHILIRIKPSPYDMANAQHYLDSIAGLIHSDSITFEKAVVKFSDDPSKINGGLLINPMNGTIKFEVDQLDPKVFFIIDKLEVGGISNPVIYENEEGKQAYRILYLKDRTNPHRANLIDDYNKIQEWALEEKKQKVINKWISSKILKTYIKINKEYWNCDLRNDWIK
ncbi:MAG: peptidylprolyl isomerase [Bacteroidales bacterium]|nr:peptidylprolyl isomerase [Bacteroidales bacterium]